LTSERNGRSVDSRSVGGNTRSRPWIDSGRLTERDRRVALQARSGREQYLEEEEEAHTPDSHEEDADRPNSPPRGSRADYARFIDSRGRRTKYYRPRKSLSPEDDDDGPDSSGDCDEPDIDANPISPSAAGRSAAAAGDVLARDASVASGVQTRDASASASAALHTGGGCARARDAPGSASAGALEVSNP
jgi:hypothetical protein